jgi:hypothetical protein
MDDLLTCAPRDPGSPIRVRGLGPILGLSVFAGNRRLQGLHTDPLQAIAVLQGLSCPLSTPTTYYI